MGWSYVPEGMNPFDGFLTLGYMKYQDSTQIDGGNQE